MIVPSVKLSGGFICLDQDRALVEDVDHLVCGRMDLVKRRAPGVRPRELDKLMLCYHPESAHQMFKTGTFFKGYKKDTFYRFDRMPSANWERLQLETARNVILDIESRTKKDHS